MPLPQLQIAVIWLKLLRLYIWLRKASPEKGIYIYIFGVDLKNKCLSDPCRSFSTLSSLLWFSLLFAITSPGYHTLQRNSNLTILEGNVNLDPLLVSSPFLCVVGCRSSCEDGPDQKRRR